jgi:hypothetical protein
VDKDNNITLFWSDSGSVGGWVYDPFQLALAVPISASLDHDGAFERVYYAILNNERLPNSAVETFAIGAYPAVLARYEYELDDEIYDQISYLIEFEEDTYGLMTFWGYPNALELQEPQFLEILATFLPPGATASAEAASEASGAACFVSTESANTVQLRVGPGYNRASVLFLPAGEDFTVIGTNTTDEGDEWFQLNKDEVVPDSAANELWVLREDVEETGDCDIVGSASAPPIVPISAQPPPANTGGDTTTAPVDTTGLITPTPGYWTWNIGATTDASCLGTPNVSFPTSELGVPLSGTAYLTNQANGNFDFSGDLFIRTPGTNSFIAGVSYDSNLNSQAYITLVSPTSANGTLIVNFSFDGVACSGTLYVTQSHN